MYAPEEDSKCENTSALFRSRSKNRSLYSRLRSRSKRDGWRNSWRSIGDLSRNCTGTEAQGYFLIKINLLADGRSAQARAGQAAA
jgi:hypothetical protein